MKNVTKLKCWDDLKNMGFEPIKYSFNGRVNSIGCSLRKKLTDHKGEIFYTDIITIEPSNQNFYHLSGKVKNPYIDKFYRYDYGRKVEFFERVDHVNQHFTARELLTEVKKMM